MSFETLYPSAANLLGNVDIPRNVFPTLRSGVRRTDPDLISNFPYYPNSSGKTLRLNYTKEVATVVTPVSIDIVIPGTSLATIIATINAADASNLLAIEQDGFLVLKNLNPGKTHLLTVAPFSTPASDAAPILGFVVDPFPGSTSFAGEIAASPGNRIQHNPQTTALLAKNDDLSSISLNRGFSSVLQLLENLRAELARDVIVYKDINLSFTAHPTDGTISAVVNDDTIRLFYPTPVIDVPTELAPSELTGFYRALDSSGMGEDVINFGSGSPNTNALLVTNLFYATSGTPFNTGAVFSAWGTPDGGTIVSSSTINKTKHPSTNVTTITGNIVQCSSATFVTHKVAAGDPVQFTASVLQPFDHSGWFAVDAVIDETHLAIRPMALTEETPVTGNKPRFLNPAAAGTLRVAVGRFVPAGNIFIAINALAPGVHVIRVPTGVPFIKTLPADRARDLSGTLGRLGLALQTHLSSSADAHSASAITGFTSSTSWRDGTSITGATLRQTIEDILTNLKAQAPGNSGIGRIGAEAIVLGGSAPNTLAQGTVATQLASLLLALQSHVTQIFGAHDATAISYPGGGNWADGTTNPATTVEVQLTKIISDLAASTGSAKIGGAASGTDIAAATLATQIANLAVNWLKMNRANTISGAQTFSALITANAGLTAAANQHITVSGTGDFKHGSTVIGIHASAFTPTGSFSSANVFINGINYVLGIGASDSNIMAPIPLRVGDRIISIEWFFNKSSSANPLTMRFRTKSGGATINDRDFFSDTSSGAGFISVVRSVNYTIAAGEVPYLDVTGGSDVMVFCHCLVTYDRP